MAKKVVRKALTGLKLSAFLSCTVCAKVDEKDGDKGSRGFRGISRIEGKRGERVGVWGMTGLPFEAEGKVTKDHPKS